MVFLKKSIVFFGLLVASVLGCNNFESEMVKPVMAHQSKLQKQGDQDEVKDVVNDLQKKLGKFIITIPHEDDLSSDQKKQVREFQNQMGLAEVWDKANSDGRKLWEKLSNKKEDDMQKDFDDTKKAALAQLKKNLEEENDQSKKENIKKLIKLVEDKKNPLGGLSCCCWVLIIFGIIIVLAQIGVGIYFLMAGSKKSNNDVQQEDYNQDFDEEDESEEGIDEENCY